MTVYNGDIIFITDTFKFIKKGVSKYTRGLLMSFLSVEEYFHFDLTEFVENYRQIDRYFIVGGFKFYIEGDKYYLVEDGQLREITHKYFISCTVPFLHHDYKFDPKPGDIEESEIDF